MTLSGTPHLYIVPLIISSNDSPDSNQETNEICEAPPTEPSLLQEDKVTWESLGNKKRRFNFDIMPKVWANPLIIIIIITCCYSYYIVVDN